MTITRQWWHAAYFQHTDLVIFRLRGYDSYDDVCTTQFKHTINDIIHRVLWVLPVICFEIAYTPSIPKWNRISLDLKNVSVNNMHSYTAVFFIDVGTFSGIRDFFNIKYGILSSLSPFSIATTFVINYENMHQERIVVGIWFAMSEMHRSCAIAKSEIPHSYHHSCLSLFILSDSSRFICQ